jgi:hypothetical protein
MPLNEKFGIQITWEKDTEITTGWNILQPLESEHVKT